MNCGRFEKLIDSYLDGQLPARSWRSSTPTGLNCRRCSRIVSMLQAAGDVIAQDHREPQISVDFADRVLAAMPTAQKANRSVWLVRLTASAAGLAAAAAIVAAVLLSNQAPVRRTAILDAVAVSKDSGLELPRGSQNVVQHVRLVAMPGNKEAAADAAAHAGTLLDGKLVRDAVNQMIWWDANRAGQ